MNNNAAKLFELEEIPAAHSYEGTKFLHFRQMDIKKLCRTATSKAMGKAV